MTPLRKRLMRAVALALMVFALNANVAAANDGGSNLDCVPYDPGLLGAELSSLPGPWSRPPGR